eukprot:m.495862 g.495862  ORF g.495862 m.495862 type:complete len:112 (+) comp21803_c0_seq1:2811-3146(+)
MHTCWEVRGLLGQLYVRVGMLIATMHVVENRFGYRCGWWTPMMLAVVTVAVDGNVLPVQQWHYGGLAVLAEETGVERHGDRVSYHTVGGENIANHAIDAHLACLEQDVRGQ